MGFLASRVRQNMNPPSLQARVDELAVHHPVPGFMGKGKAEPAIRLRAIQADVGANFPGFHIGGPQHVTHVQLAPQVLEGSLRPARTR